ncbi:transcriptional regulator [Paenibacillus sp. LC231]|uniref:ROK family protein n=1 Tax=Paenibacillus sp. LC231 TaxID=1120679 RepID=UPI0008DE5BB9|nr:ROK family protein [Paenibacillus sp. LC231]OIA98909.1 transcriptional regulator [Paenibacillus sp. LC231]
MNRKDSADPESVPSPAPITIALDAGGTALKGALIVNGLPIPGSFITRPSESHGAAVDTIASFAQACHDLIHYHVSAFRPLDYHDSIRIGFAFPGPFDYAKGIALLQGLGKYDALFKQSVRDLLRTEFQRLKSSFPGVTMNRLTAADIRFGNDAFMFGLGASTRFPSERLLCLTLGTGLGSAFVENGQIVAGRHGIPSSGMLFAEPYRDHIVDSYFGKRSILNMASERGLLADGIDVADLAEAAKSGNAQAQDVFREYGSKLGEMLLPYLSEFKPSRLVLGGQISGSLPLWEKDIQLALGRHAVPVHALADGTAAVFNGIEKLFEDTDHHESAPHFNL